MQPAKKALKRRRAWSSSDVYCPPQSAPAEEQTDAVNLRPKAEAPADAGQGVEEGSTHAHRAEEPCKSGLVSAAIERDLDAAA